MLLRFCTCGWDDRWGRRGLGEAKRGGKRGEGEKRVSKLDVDICLLRNSFNAFGHVINYKTFYMEILPFSKIADQQTHNL